MTQKDDVNQSTPAEPPKYDLDLDAIGDEAQPKQGVVLPKKGSSLSIKEWKELKDRDPSTLTTSELSLVNDAEAKASEAIEKFAANLPDFSLATKLGKDMQDAFKGLDLGLLRNMPSLEPPMVNMRAFVPATPASSIEQQRQTNLLSRLVEAIENQNAERDAGLQKLLSPSYDAKERKLIFANTVISIPPTSDQEILCKKLFRSGKPVKNPVEKGDLYEALGVTGQAKEAMRKKVYSAKDALNLQVAKQTAVNDLFVMVDKKLWFNQKYM